MARFAEGRLVAVVRCTPSRSELASSVPTCGTNVHVCLSVRRVRYRRLCYDETVCNCAFVPRKKANLAIPRHGFSLCGVTEISEVKSCPKPIDANEYVYMYVHLRELSLCNAMSKTKPLAFKEILSVADGCILIEESSSWSLFYFSAFGFNKSLVRSQTLQNPTDSKSHNTQRSILAYTKPSPQRLCRSCGHFALHFLASASQSRQALPETH